ncbi:histidine phosphatase family protein [Microlunatus sp. Y2014]|uniref:histidine phosphatase family protein n=1 Tax=Microlunatus sp. Y2014 TaxID=3418488 RepID=UPI003DA76A30
MTEIHLMRHGETEWSASGRHTSYTDLDLTDNGVAEAEALRDKLDPSSYQLVLCSPRLRARRTAEIAGFTELVTEPDLVEWNYGEYEGRTSAEIREEVPGWTVWTHPSPGGETADEVTARMTNLIALIRQSGAERVACFAHGHSLRALTLTWLGLDLTLGDHFPLGTGTVSVLGDYKDGQALLQWNAR